MSNELKYAIYGASGFGREVYCYLRDTMNDQNVNWDFIGFFDDGSPTFSSYSKYGKIIGGIDLVNSWDEPLNLIIAIADPTVRKSLIEKITNKIIQFPNLIFSDVRIFDQESFSIGIGNIIFSKCSFSVDTVVGDYNIFNGSISMGHDSVIGNFNSFMPGSKVSGMVEIGNGNQFGMNSTILQNLRMGDFNKIAPNTMISKNIGSDATYFGTILKKL
jgi:sugar O-acyltransferase (sialic acid O-acetyltransferase NeuD family)